MAVSNERYRLPGPPAGRGLVERLRGRGAGALGEGFDLLALVIIALFAHGVNMYNFPAFTFNGDEGIYVGQALAVLEEGRLSWYTYWYDHAPAGWIFLAAWIGASGGPYTFGSPIESGRVFMLLLNLANVALLYRIGRKLAAPRPLAALAALIFALSPLALTYRRMVMLDNMMSFWLLVSLDLLLDGHGRLSRVIGSGVAFGIAALTKETAVFLLPALLWISWQERRDHHGHFAVVGWVLPLAIVVSWYPLFAILKGEFLPAALSARLFGDVGPHVSLLETLFWQLSRGGEHGGIFNLQNQFWQRMREDWLPADRVTIVGGALAVAVNLARGIVEAARGLRRSDLRSAIDTLQAPALSSALLGMLPLLYLARGGIVFSFYILFALPFLCLNIAVALRPLAGRLPARYAWAATALAAAALCLFYWQSGALRPLYTTQSSAAGRAAIAWIKHSLPANSFIIADDAFLPALRVPALGEAAFPNTHSHWKVGGDPTIYQELFDNSWRTVDYLIMTEGLEATFAAQHESPVALDAFHNASLVRSWRQEGVEVALWKVNRPGATEGRLLEGAAAHIDGQFLRDGAYVSTDGTVRAESQANGMLRAVWSDDRRLFDRVWGWTRANLLNERGLLSLSWRYGLRTADSTADANTDAALALILAGERWGDPALHEAGVQLARAIWEHEVAHIEGVPYITAGSWAVERDVVVINPSYIAPYAHRVFARVDPARPWSQVIDSGYGLLREASAAGLTVDAPVGLPPDWVGLRRATGELVPLAGAAQGLSNYGLDAARSFWRIALDQRWSDDPRAAAHLASAAFLRDRLEATGRLGTVYSRDGRTVEAAGHPIGSAGAFAALLTADPAAAHRLYSRELVGGAIWEDGVVHWGRSDDLAAQEWNWFAVALYAGRLSAPDVWGEE